MSSSNATIVAIATGPGRGGIGVVRISGNATRAIAKAFGRGVELEPRRATLTTFTTADGAVIDEGLALFFPAPHSFTGEDVLELQVHGNPVVLDRLLRRACELGACPARAGEFSERAFLNGKLDLAQAEAVADLIAARSEAQADAAQRSLQGDFSKLVRALDAMIVRLRVAVEAGIDFSDDASGGASTATLVRLFDEAQACFEALLAAARRGVRLTDGVHAVIMGEPNVGKSSLLNALVGNDRAIVTDVPGTTRDVLRESILLDGVELTLVDTAGLRESADAVEGEGIRRARAELARADLVMRVIEYPVAQDVPAWPAEVPGKAARILAINKIDRAGVPPGSEERDGIIWIALSARTGDGLDLLRAALRHTALKGQGDGAFSARTRHVLALERAGAALAEARMTSVSATPELVAEDLRVAQQALGEITGEFSSEDLLGAIFSTFCIGK